MRNQEMDTVRRMAQNLMADYHNMGLPTQEVSQTQRPDMGITPAEAGVVFVRESAKRRPRK